MSAADFHRYKGDGGSIQAADGGSSRRERGRYLASPELAIAVNTALAAQQPLLVTGEPGVGKTALAQSIADELALGPVLEFHTHSDHQARDCLYAFDSMLRFYDAQVGYGRARTPAAYIRYQALGQAIRAGAERVVLIDEIDKAQRDFANDLLNVIDRMEFEVVETGERFDTRHRPIVIMTSNGERRLPEPFLRRCVYHHIRFPSPERLREILEERLAPADRLAPLAEAAVDKFVKLRGEYGEELERAPSTGELLAWVRVLLRAGNAPDALAKQRLEDLPYLGALLKTEHDLALVWGRRMQ